MDKSQSELTDKIRSAIKKKLTEINAFVDDELPEYIMILVANKRSKTHIEKDLSLFLGNDTVDFTSWLWDLLNSLKVGSKGNSVSVSKKDEEDSNTKDVDEDADVLDYDPDEQEGDFLCQEDTNESLISHSSVRKTDSDKSVKPPEAPPVRPKMKEKVDTSNRKDKKAAKVHPLQPTAVIPPYSSVVPVRKGNAVDSTDEYDPTKPDYVGNVSSVVCVTQRKYGGSAALQANKLLLRAVDDATKSVLDGKSLNDFYKPTPIKVLASKRQEKILSSDSRDIFTVTDDNIIKSKLRTKASKLFNFVDSNFSTSDVVMNDSYVVSQPSFNRTIHFKEATDISSDSCLDNVDVISRNEYSMSSDFEEKNSKSPHFIVTLEGVNLKSLKRKRFETCSMENMEEEEENEVLDEEMTDLISPRKQKLNERCRYWPACKNSDHCTYHHPTIPCKCFPDCKFGDKCMYIHPNCKFDALCSRKDCPYTHASKRKLPLAVVPVAVPVKSRSIRTVCKFYPRCTAKKCPFVHPKLCRYGTLCRSPKCPYTHFNVPSRNQMKWQANSS